MTDLPILMSPPMVRAILREIEAPGTGKTQTRRIIKPQPYGRISMLTSFDHGRMEIAFGPDMKAKDGGPLWWRPLAQDGDRLWVREAWRLPAVQDDSSPTSVLHGFHDIGCSGPNGLVRFEADGCDAWLDPYGALPMGRLRPSIHLPRELTRLTLYVTEVRVQRLQDISEEDARSEGANVAKASRRVADDYATMAVAGIWFSTARAWYADLWDRINGPGSWAENPWVAAYTFVPRLGNIDSLPDTLMEEA